MGDDWRQREIMVTNFEMIDINAIKPESGFVKRVNTHKGHWYHS
jgi:hypothetical protein